MMMHKNNDFLAYFNGHYMPISQVVISPFDRGFLFGDSIYEVVPVYGGKTLGGDQHWLRLMQGLLSVGIESPFTLSDWPGVAAPLLENDEVGANSLFVNDGESSASTETAQLLYIQVTRGVEQSRKHRFPVDAPPTVLIFSIPFIPPVTKDFSGSAGHLQADLRWQRCSIKSTSLMGNILAYHQLFLEGAGNDEALLVRNEKVVEAPSSNLFMAKDEVIYTPPVDNILSGVTRSLVISIAREMGFEVREQAPDVALLKSADEVWVTNSFEELKPIVSIDGGAVGEGIPGRVWQQLFDGYQQLKT